MGDQASVRAFADAVSTRFEQVDALIHNAAVFDITQREARLTVDGIEQVWATNFVGPWLLTRALRPLLERASPGRVIDVSSKGLLAYPFLKVDPAGAARGDRYSPERALLPIEARPAHAHAPPGADGRGVPIWWLTRCGCPR